MQIILLGGAHIKNAMLAEKKNYLLKIDFFFFPLERKNVSNSKNDNVLLFRWDEFIVYKDFEKFTTYFFRFAIKENTHTKK